MTPLLLVLGASALANGQTTHIWITLDAVGHLPAGELRDLAADEALRSMLVHGAMFPDGGYAVGDAYGETAHWEPFQDAYLRWIREAHPDLTGAGREHVAFLLGLASHGMADQVFDAMYMARAKEHDAESPWSTASMDEATDVVFASLTGAQQVPSTWVPYEDLVAIYGEDLGYEVDAGTLERGQAALGVAVAYVGLASEVDETVTSYAAQFPWATAHLLDEDVPGSPPCEGALVAAYWERLWERLHGGDGLSAGLLGSRPADGGHQAVRSAASIDAMVSFVVPRGLDRASLTDASVTVTGSGGAAHPVTVDLFYGQDSHVVNVRPLEDWAEEADYTVTFHGATSFDGVPVPGDAFTFTTTPPPREETGAAEPTGCGCATGPSFGWGWLLVPWWRRRRRR